MIVENKKYFVTEVNSSKANKMTALYHYSGVGYKKAKLNLGVFSKSDNKLVGVMQWGCSYQHQIKLDRYVKEPIDKDTEYLELNRFSMADSEGKNSESQALSLGIKWIRQNMPNIKLLVSYAGRKEGNYGYIYQATNWKYLGYFISEGFWFVDGVERHLATLWYHYNKHDNSGLSFIDSLCNKYSDVRKTWTKQFIYIITLDPNLTEASSILPYPKPSNEFPIKTRERIYKQNDDVYNNPVKTERQYVEYYYTPDEDLFSRRVLIARGELEKGVSKKQFPLTPIAMYDIGGHLEAWWKNIKLIDMPEYLPAGIKESVKFNKSYKNKYFRLYDGTPPEIIDVPIICIIDEIPFNSLSEVGRYLGVSRQAVHQAKNRKAATIREVPIIWVNN